jgi:hypothetical protein
MIKIYPKKNEILDAFGLTEIIPLIEFSKEPVLKTASTVKELEGEPNVFVLSINTSLSVYINNSQVNRNNEVVFINARTEFITVGEVYEEKKIYAQMCFIANYNVVSYFNRFRESSGKEMMTIPSFAEIIDDIDSSRILQPTGE